ncbi:MAG: hypothetical protein ACQKBT_02530 [Puniceicoccales bacterium]
MKNRADPPYFRRSADDVRALLRDGRLVAYRDDGLFARLSCFANAIRVSAKLGLPRPRGLWETGDFSGNRVHGYRDTFADVFDWGECIDVAEVAQGGGEGAVFSWPFLCVLDDEDPDSVLQELVEIVSDLRLKAPYREPMERALEKLTATGPHVGVHCRAGDVEGKIEWMFRKGYPAAFWKMFFAEKAKADSGERFYVASNSDGLRKKAAESLWARSESLADFLTLEELGDSQMAYDFADNRLFAAGESIVGCGYSSFVIFACMRAGQFSRSPLQSISSEIAEAYLDLNDLWKGSYLADVSYLMGIELGESDSVTALKAKGYWVANDPGDRQVVGGLSRRLQRGFLRCKSLLKLGEGIESIRTRFYRISRW